MNWEKVEGNRCMRNAPKISSRVSPKSSQQTARDGWKNMGVGKWLEVLQNRRADFDDVALQNTLRFILSIMHISMHSWDKKTVKLDRWQWVDLPILTRRITLRLMWKSYNAWDPGNLNEHNMLKRTSF